MPRGRGQIPPYGKSFRRERIDYDPVLSSTVYVLKQDDSWFIRSDKTSHVWHVFYVHSLDTVIQVGTPLGTLTEAMTRLLDGIALGFYVTA